jgi:hypothetical protein
MVKKLKVKVTAEELAIAESHGIAYNTVYTRMQRGWDKHRAITESPKTSPAQTLGLERNAEGSIISDNPKGKQRSIRLPAEWDEKADQAIAQSGLTQSEWVAGVIVEHLQKKKKGN